MPSFIQPRECVENCPHDGGIYLSAPVIYSTVLAFVAIVALCISFCIISSRLRRLAAHSKPEKSQEFSKALCLSPSNPYFEPAPPYEPATPMPPTPTPLLKFPLPSYSPV